MIDARTPGLLRLLIRIAGLGIGFALVAGCAREEEMVLRDRLENWFSIGETVSFNATRTCAAAAFKLVDLQVKSMVPLVDSTPQVLVALSQRGLVAINNPALAPDAALAELVNADRPTGMKMRRAALEGRMCMDQATESAFRYALDNPLSMLAYDDNTVSLMLLDPRTGLLVVAMGGQEWR